MRKVFGIGMFRTGTTSLGRCLDILGHRTLHGPWWPTPEMIRDPWYLQPEAWAAFDDVIQAKLTEYDAFQDYPWMYAYRQADSGCPDARFVLTVRDPEWVVDSEIRRWMKGDNPIPPRQKFRDRYLRHRDGVLEYFADRDDLLVLSFEDGDGWAQLCPFLDLPDPGVPIPHLNKGSDHIWLSKMGRRLKRWVRGEG